MGANACQTGRRCVRQKREFEGREGFLGCSGVGLPAYPGHRPGVGCWHVDVGLRGGTEAECAGTIKGPEGPFIGDVQTSNETCKSLFGARNETSPSDQKI